MAYLIVAAVAFVVGSGLAYGFRGWIERTKAKERAALQAAAAKVISKL